MIGFLKFLLLAPVAVVLVLAGVANRHAVTLVLDPFTQGSAAAGITLPLFVLLFGALLVGIIIGYVASWFAQGQHRKAERQLRKECDRLNSECDRLKAQTHAPTGPAALLARP